MNKLNISFNYQMQMFRLKYERNNIKKDMAPFWKDYQKLRFKESYYPAFKKEKNKKNLFRIAFELTYLLFKWKCLPYHYFRYSLYKKDYKINNIDLYLPETIFYYSILPNINSEYNLLDDKNVTYDILSSNNIPVPKCLLKVINKNIIDNSGNLINNDVELAKYFKSLKNNEIIAKFSYCGSGGKQILILRKEKNFFKYNKQILTCSLLKEHFNNWIFQEKLHNIQELSKIHPNSLNTFRIMTYIKEKEPLIIYAMLKFGNNNAFTDNAHTNGIYIKVNIENSITEGLAYNENLECFNKHPLSKHKVDNIVIPNFDAVLQIVKKAAMIFPKLTFVGWDIALTENGPVVLEGNSSPGLTIIQRTHNGMERFINLYDDKNKA